MKKGGMGHIEMILAFVLFIAFLFFGIFFFNPLNTDRLLDSSADYAYREILKNVSYDVTSYSVIINHTDPVVVSIPISTFQTDAQSSFLVLNSKGKVVESEIQNIGYPVLTFNRGVDRYVRVISGNFIAKGHSLTGSALLDSSNYSISSSESKKLVMESGFRDLKMDYDSEYLLLKKQFNLPGRVDFAFSLVLSETEKITADQEIPEGLEVIAKQDRIEIVNSDGDSQFADLIVRVW